MKRMLMALMACAGSCAFAEMVRVRVMDDEGISLAGVETRIIFGHLGVSGSDSYTGMTDSAGIATASGRATSTVRVIVERHGYYRADIDNLPIGRDLDLPITLRKIVHPVPLFVKMASVRATELTGKSPRREKVINDDVIGYDLEVGDAMPPLGHGRHCDIILNIHAEFRGWRFTESEMERLRGDGIHMGKGDAELRGNLAIGKWDATLQVSFPNEKEGLIEVRKDFLEYSGMKMPREAPVDGYMATWRTMANNYAMTNEENAFGLFIRTRVKQDEKGRIISANYGKIPRAVTLDPRGVAIFTYYFNPAANDRNLEFDVERNLFPEPKSRARVNLP